MLPWRGAAFAYLNASTGGSVSGVVLADGSPFASASVDLFRTGYFEWAETGPDGFFEFNNVPPGSRTVSMIVPLGYRALSPEGGTATVAVCPGQTTTIDFTLEALGDAGPARSMGYWEHQVNVHYFQRGNAQESYDDMNYTYGQRIQVFEHNPIHPVNIDLVTSFRNNPTTSRRSTLCSA
jgi:hypothetical protein